MRWTRMVALAVLLLPASAAPAQSPFAEEVPPPVVRHAERVWTRLIDTLDVAALLRPSCKELAANAADSDPFIQPDVLRTLTNQEVCDTIIAWATVHLQFRIAGLARRSMQDVDSLTDGQAEAMTADLMRGFFPGLGIQYSPERDWFVDASGRGFFGDIETREDITRLHEAMKRFRGLEAQGVMWQTSTLKANGDWFARQFPGSSTLKRTASGAFRQCRYSVCLTISDEDGQPKVIGFGLFSQ